MTTAAGGGMRFAFDSCLSECDCGIDRRPYHRNCGCALHKSKSRDQFLRKAAGSNGSSGRVAFPIRRSWSEGCLALANPATAYSSGNSSPASGASPVMEIIGIRRKASLNQFVELCAEEEEEDDDGVGRIR